MYLGSYMRGLAEAESLDGVSIGELADLILLVFACPGSRLRLGDLTVPRRSRLVSQAAASTCSSRSRVRTSGSLETTTRSGNFSSARFATGARSHPYQASIRLPRH